jgi:putative membrane protein
MPISWCCADAGGAGGPAHHGLPGHAGGGETASIPIDPEAPAPKALAARLRYDLKYLLMLVENPLVQEERGAIEESILRGQALLERARRAGPEEALMISADLEHFERDHIEALLKPLDKKVDQLIHAEAVGVGIATAVSMNGTVDAFIVLWRNANLVAKVARVYFGRPHLWGSLRILRDVAAIVVVARALEDVTDLTGDVIGSLLGRMGGLVAGPVMDGGVNAMMTLKLGYLAKRRCRSFKGWSSGQAKAISAEALKDVKEESGSVIGDLLKGVGGLTSTATPGDREGAGRLPQRLGPGAELVRRQQARPRRLTGTPKGQSGDCHPAQPCAITTGEVR